MKKEYQKGRHLSYRVKLTLIYSITVLLVAASISFALTVAAAQRMEEDMKAHLNLLTEQVLFNFSDSAAAAAQQLINMTSSKGVSSLMNKFRDMKTGDSGYYQSIQSLVYAVNQMITATTYYDQIYVRMDNGLSFTNAFPQETFMQEAAALLDSEEYGGNAYGRTQWVRSESGRVYIIRDIYTQTPFRHVGKIAAQVRQAMLASLGSYNNELNCAVLFLGTDGTTLSMAGETAEDMAAAAGKIAIEELTQWKMQGVSYVTSIQKNGDWTAVGMLPEKMLHAIRLTMAKTGVVVALLGVALGGLSVLASTKRMTRQIRLLVRSMDEVAAGNMTLSIPVESLDEIGQTAAHFNRMIKQTRELLQRVVEEESRKSKAEYEILEYKYRSLQSQINPHFIYNALETVNALAKIDGNEEICDVVQHISAFFGQNTGNMQKRFIPLRQEFDSLREYAYIYRHIHGETLSTPFVLSSGVADALIPTMILQPVLENALVHGVRPASDQALVRITAQEEGKRLVIEVEDNGSGMQPETVEMILTGQADDLSNGARMNAGIGMRNVRDRLKLIYGEQAVLHIQSSPSKGTLVSIRSPLIYDKKELEAGGYGGGL